MKIKFRENRARIAFVAHDITRVDADDETMAVLAEIQRSIRAQLKLIPEKPSTGFLEALFGTPKPGEGIEIDLEPGQWRICKDSLLASEIFRSVVMTISVALEKDGKPSP